MKRNEMFDLEDFESLTHDMDQASRFLMILPEEQEWSQRQIEILVDTLHEAMILAEEIKITIELFQNPQSRS